jgi:hypothetical protein
VDKTLFADLTLAEKIFADKIFAEKIFAEKITCGQKIICGFDTCGEKNNLRKNSCGKKFICGKKFRGHVRNFTYRPKKLMRCACRAPERLFIWE